MKAKRVAAEKAVEFVEDGMIVGIGIGSIAYWTIRKLGNLDNDGLIFKAIPT